MRPRLFLLLLPLIWLCRPAHATELATGGSVASTQSVLPASAMPAHVKTVSIVPLVNADMDCLWNFLCQGGVPTLPALHDLSQEDLGRITGWAESDLTTHHPHFSVVLFDSRYATAEDAAAAYSDFNDVMNGSGALPARIEVTTPLGLIPNGSTGKYAAWMLKSTPDKYFLIDGWVGDQEIEGGVHFYLGRGFDARAWRVLCREALATLAIAPEFTWTQGPKR